MNPSKLEEQVLFNYLVKAGDWKGYVGSTGLKELEPRKKAIRSLLIAVSYIALILAVYSITSNLLQ